MPIKVAVPKETADREKRVAMVPVVSAKLAKQVDTVAIQAGAGAGFKLPDTAFNDTEIAADTAALYDGAGITLKVQPPTLEEVAQLPEGSVIISFMAAHNNLEMVAALRERNITAFAMELVPRISRAQSMDALSSQAAIAGYQGTLIAADLLDRFFPMLTTAAGTIRPAKAVVIGAGVSGLQAIATCRRLGAMVEGYDVRSATKEQVESLGAKFIDTGVTADAAGGYARELTEDEIAQQRKVLAEHMAKADVVISTASIPGRPSPKIIFKDMVKDMKAGAVIVDLAAEGGGNCELTKPGKTTKSGNVTIAGPLNVPSMTAEHASEMYARNLLNLLEPMLADGEFAPDWTDEVVVGSVLTHDGVIRHEPTRAAVAEALGADKAGPDAPAAEPESEDA